MAQMTVAYVGTKNCIEPVLSRVFVFSDEELEVIKNAIRESGGSASFEEVEDIYENLLDFFENNH